MDIIALIGETTEYDKKQAVEAKKPKSWCKSISAFANGRGGKLIFGIADDNTIIGLENAEKDAETISEQIKVHLNPIPEFTLRFQKVEGKTLMIVEVYAGEQTPYYYSGDGMLTAFIRIGNQSVQAKPQQLSELVLKGSNATYDSLPSKYQFDDMAFTKLKSVFYQQTGHSFAESDYESFGLIDEKGNLTNAGALLADESPIKQSRLFCTRWNGLDKADGVVDAIDDAEISGSIIILLQEGLAFVKRHSRKMWQKTADGRLEMPDYPERAVLEGIVNAIIHRNYNEIGSEVHIDIFDDRLEIYSPGGMFDGTKVQDRDLMNVPSRRRNPVIADVFNRLKYMDRRGSGFKKILSAYKTLPNYTEEKRPVFTSEYDCFFLTMWNMNYGVVEDVEVGNGDTQEKTKEKAKEKTKENHNAIQNRILELIKENPQITIAKISESLAITNDSARYHVKKMKKNGVIEHCGSTKRGYWKIK